MGALVLERPTATIREERTTEERYRIYRLVDGEPELLATTPSRGGIGVCLVTLSEEGEIDGDDRVGILDGILGSWIVNPFGKGR